MAGHYALSWQRYFCIGNIGSSLIFSQMALNSLQADILQSHNMMLNRQIEEVSFVSYSIFSDYSFSALVYALIYSLAQLLMSYLSNDLRTLVRISVRSSSVR